MPDDSTELAVRAPMNVATMTDQEIDRLYRISKGLALSGMFKDARQADQAFTKILLGRDLGLSPTQAMTGIHIVEGKPQVAATTLAMFVKQTDGCDYRVREHTEEACSIEFFQDGDSLGISSFTIQEARKAGLVRPRSPWENYPRNMLFARAMSNGVKWFVPQATAGIPVYYEGEIVEEATLSEGVGTGEPADVELPAEVEAVLTRAEALGHTAVADRGSAAMAANTQMPAEDIEQWVTMATSVLDGYELDQARDEMTEAEVVPDA